METKICCNCKQEKPVESFTIRTARKGGRSYRCKECDKYYNRTRTIPKKPKKSCTVEQKQTLILDVMEEYECNRITANNLIAEETYLRAWHIGSTKHTMSMVAYRLACIVLLGSEYDPKHDDE